LYATAWGCSRSAKDYGK